MPGLTGATPEDAFRAFREHIAGILNRTVTDARLALIHKKGSADAQITFRREDQTVVAAPLFARGLYLFAAQTLRVDRQPDKKWRLRTLRYSYHLLDSDERRQDNWCIRWEYVSSAVKPMLYPRHHAHLAAKVQFAGRELPLDQLHLSTGWVTIEEVIRFLIVELGVTPKIRDWDVELRNSEEIFKGWTGRSI